MEHPALQCFTPRSEPAVRLICFPHAGGGAHAFAEWGALLPDWIEVHGVAYPGRGARSAEAFAASFEALAAECASAARTLRDRPIALLGHSFGALVWPSVQGPRARRRA